MTALIIQTEKVSKLNQLDFTENRTICEQSGTNGTSLKLVLQRRLKKGKHKIYLVGFAYKEGELEKHCDLGAHRPDKNGVETILSACECYDYSGMYECIKH